MKKILLFLLAAAIGTLTAHGQTSPLPLPKVTVKPAKKRTLYERNGQPLWQDSTGLEHDLLGGGAGTSDYNLLSNRPLVYAATTSALRALLPEAGTVYRLNEWGREGDFVYEASSTLPDDDGYCIIAQSGRRLVRVNVREIEARWYGLTYDTQTDNTAKIRAARNAARRMKWNLRLPDGIAINDTIHHPGRGLHVRGDGRLVTNLYCRNSSKLGLFVLREKDCYIEQLSINVMYAGTGDNFAAIRVEPGAYFAYLDALALYKPTYSAGSKGIFLNYTTQDGTYYGKLTNSTIQGFGVGFDCSNPSVGTGGGGWEISHCTIGGNGVDMRLRDAYATHVNNCVIGLIGNYTGGLGIDFLDGCAEVQITNTLFEVDPVPTNQYIAQFRFNPGARRNFIQGTSGGANPPAFIDGGQRNAVRLSGSTKNGAGGPIGDFYNNVFDQRPSLVLDDTLDHRYQGSSLLIRTKRTVPTGGYTNKIGFDAPMSGAVSDPYPVAWIGAQKRADEREGGLVFQGTYYNVDTLGLWHHDGLETWKRLILAKAVSVVPQNPTGTNLALLNHNGVLKLQNSAGAWDVKHSGNQVFDNIQVNGGFVNNVSSVTAQGNVIATGYGDFGNFVQAKRIVTAGNLTVVPQFRGTAFGSGLATYTDPTSSGTVGGIVSAVGFGQATFAAQNPVTYANAVGLLIEGPPLAGTNVTLSERWAVYSLSGKNYFEDEIRFGAGRNATLNNLLPAQAGNAGKILSTNGTDASWIDAPSAGAGGEANTASNLGTGEGLFTAKSGVNLPFKSLKAGGAASLSSNANEVTITVPAQLQADWNQTNSSALDFIKNKPTIPTDNAQLANGAGYVTQSGARSAISLTTTGNSGPASYNPTTGALNVPTYTAAGLGAEPTIGSGTTGQFWRGDKTWSNTLSGALTATRLLADGTGFSGNPGVAGLKVSIPAYTFTDNATAASGTVTTNANVGFATPTFAATNTAVTVTNGVNLYVAGAPSAGTNVTITNPWAFYVASGQSYLGGQAAVNGNILPNITTTYNIGSSSNRWATGFFQTLNLTSALAVAQGGTGATTLTGYLRGNGTSAFTATATIPNTDVTGLGTFSTQNTGAFSTSLLPGADNSFTVGSQTFRLSQLWATRASIGDASALDANAVVQFPSSTRMVLFPSLTASVISGMSTPGNALLGYQNDGTQGFYGRVAGAWRRHLHDGDIGSTVQAFNAGTSLIGQTIETSEVTDDAVTNAKLANMAQSTLKGRATASTGDPEDVGVSNTLALTAGQLRSYQRATLTIPSAGNAENITCFYTPFAVTVSHLGDAVMGTGSPSFSYNIRYASTRDAASPTTLFASDRTVSSTAGSTTTTFTNPTIPAGSWVWLTSSAVAGTVGEVSVTFYYY